MKRKLAYLLGIFISSVMALNFAQAIVGTLRSSRRLSDLQAEVQKKREELVELKNVLAYRESDEFVEKEARDKLMMIKPRETLVVVGEKRGEKGTSKSEILEKTNPEKWRYLFFRR